MCIENIGDMHTYCQKKSSHCWQTDSCDKQLRMQVSALIFFYV